ncbi:MAG: methionyl-tRNA formyltransferase [bacterium]|nr:methionyl-tRNA formyltransferase [bacterium]
MKAQARWQRPRRVSVVANKSSWILPYAEDLVSSLTNNNERAILCRSYNEMQKGDVAFFLGCIEIASPETLALNRINLVVHASDLPKGRGHAPLVWQILEGHNEIPVCLFKAILQVDSGPVIFREKLVFGGHELLDEMREALGKMTVSLCKRFLAELEPPEGEPQRDEATYYPRRTPVDSRLDPRRSLAEQFNLLRTVDNIRHPAFFEMHGFRYKMTIEKMPMGDISG